MVDVGIAFLNGDSFKRALTNKKIYSGNLICASIVYLLIIYMGFSF
jgi:hypothetical protein